MRHKYMLALIFSCSTITILQGASQSTWQLLNAAIISGNAEEVEQLVNHVDVNKVDTAGGSLLHLAISMGNENIVPILLKAGADPNHENNIGLTPLVYAALCEYEKIAQQLAQHGADVNYPNMDGLRPLHCAIQHANPKAAEILLRVNADIHLNSTRVKRTDLMHCPLAYAALKGDIEMAQFLLDKGANIRLSNICANDSFPIEKKYAIRTALCAAIEQGNVAMVRFLTSKGADINGLSQNTKTPLSSAAAQGHMNIVKILVNAGAQVSKVGRQGLTPLEYAAKRGDNQMVTFLLAAYNHNIDGTPEILDTVNGFLPRYEWQTPLCLAAAAGKKRTVRLLLDKGASPFQANDWGETPLWHAVESHNIEIVQLLLDLGVDINKGSPWEGSPLVHAIRKGPIKCAGRTAVIQLLINAGADVDQLGPDPDNCDNDNDEMLTPLITAIRQNDIPTITMLLSEGANIHKSFSTGYTALMAAAEQGNAEIIKLLLKVGADTEQLDQYQFSALVYACDEECTKTVQLLLNAGASIDSWLNGASEENKKIIAMQADTIIPARAEVIRACLNQKAAIHGLTCFPVALQDLVGDFAHSPISTKAVEKAINRISPYTSSTCERPAKRQRLQ